MKVRKSTNVRFLFVLFSLTTILFFIEVAIKMGEGGKAFGSVSSKEIAEEVKKQMDLTIDKKKVQLKEAIRTLGTHTVPVKLHPKVTAELKVVVKEEA